MALVLPLRVQSATVTVASMATEIAPPPNADPDWLPLKTQSLNDALPST